MSSKVQVNLTACEYTAEAIEGHVQVIVYPESIFLTFRPSQQNMEVQ